MSVLKQAFTPIKSLLKPPMAGLCRLTMQRICPFSNRYNRHGERKLSTALIAVTYPTGMPVNDHRDRPLDVQYENWPATHASPSMLS